MLLALVGLVLGLVVLTVAADLFVAGAAGLSVRARLSPVVVGAVVIGFGTSAPELVVSTLAAVRGDVAIAVGNVLGSNIANLTLILGVACLITPIVVASPTIRREAPLTLAATAAFVVAILLDLPLWVGIVLLVGLAVTVTAVVRGGGPDVALTEEVEEYLDEQPPSLRGQVVRAVGGLVGVLVAAQVLVVSAVAIADEVGLDEGFVGLTIVAIGTSLPELATSVQAARRRETDLVLGNLLGSNVFNALGVGGVTAVVGTGAVPDGPLTSTALVLVLGVTLLGVAAMITGRRVSRPEGVGLLVVWAVTLPLLA